MINLFRFFRGNGKKDITNREIIQAIENLNINVCDKNFDLLEEINKTKDKYFKLENEYKKSLELLAKREKYCQNLEEQAKVIDKINKLENSVNLAIKKIDLLSDVLVEFKGKIYEVKRVRSCTGSKQKIQVKSSTKTSSIIKKVVGNSNEK